MSYLSVKLGDVCEVLSGYAWTAAKFNSDGIGMPVIRIQNVASVMDCDFVYWDEAYDERFVIRTGDIVLTLSGSFRVESWQGPEALLNQRIVKLSPSSKLDNRWFLNVLQTRLREIEGLGRHALVNNVSIGDIKNLDIPLPPLPEQRRIAAILDQSDALRAKRREALAQLDSLTQSIFIEMFGDPSSNPKSWQTTPIGKCIQSVTNGLTRRRSGSDEGRSIVLRLRDIRSSWIDFSEVNRITLEPSEISRFGVTSGDLLFIRVNGNPDYVGRCAVFEEYSEPVFFNDHIMRVRIDQAQIHRTYLGFLLNSPHGKSEIAKHRKTSAGQHTINQEGLGKIQIPVPPISLQAEFARRLNRVVQEKSTHLESLAELDALFASLQHRAFSGEL